MLKFSIEYTIYDRANQEFESGYEVENQSVTVDELVDIIIETGCHWEPHTSAIDLDEEENRRSGETTTRTLYIEGGNSTELRNMLILYNKLTGQKELKTATN